MKSFRIWGAVLLMAIAGLAGAQERRYTEGPVLAVTSVKVLDGQFENYMKFLDGDQRRGGALPAELPALAERVAGASALDLLGLMAVAPLGVDPAASFAALAELSEQLRAEHPAAVFVSAGMSGDLEAAIIAGATHVRVGSAVLGGRPPLG